MSTEFIDRTDAAQESSLPHSAGTAEPARDSLIRRVGKFVLRGTRPHDIRCSIWGVVTRARSGAQSFGRHPWVYGKVCFHIRGPLIIGDYFRAGGHSTPVCIKVHKGGTLTIGDHVGINVGTRIEAYHDLRIGSHVMMAPCVAIIDDNCHDIEPGAPRYKSPVVIGDNVWLGQNVVVLPGVTIGDGSVIGANSVVTKDIPPSVYAAGSPARVLRKLELPDGWYRV